MFFLLSETWCFSSSCKNTEKIRSCAIVSSDGIEISDYVKDGNTIFCSADAGEEGGQIRFPLFGFMGYQAEINGRQVSYTCTGNNQLTIDVTKGHSDIHIRYAGKAIWHLFDVLSLVSLILLIILMNQKRMLQFKHRTPAMPL